MIQPLAIIAIFALISFFVDAGTAYLCACMCTQMLLCTYLYAVTYYPSLSLLVGIGTLLSIQDCIFFGYAGIQLIYVIPLTFCSYALSHRIYPNSIQLITIALISGVLQTYLIKRYILHHTIALCYTVSTIYGIIIGVMLISLIFWLRGMLGNRIRS